MNLKALAGLVTFVFCYSVWPAGEYPKVIQKIIDQESRGCQQQGKGELTVSSIAIQSFRLNNDADKDYLVDESGFDCTTDQNMHAGSTPIRIKIYLSHKKKWKMAWSGMVLAYKFDKEKSLLNLEFADEKNASKVVKKVLKFDNDKASIMSSSS